MKRLAPFTALPFFLASCGQPDIEKKPPITLKSTAPAITRIDSTKAVQQIRIEGQKCIADSSEKPYKLICDLVAQQDIIAKSFAAERRSAGNNDQNHLKLISEAQKNEEKLLAELEKEIAGLSAQEVIDFIDTLKNIDRKYRLQTILTSLSKRVAELNLELTPAQKQIISAKNIG